ncbi:hypothetical protein chiPu_0009295 [Chiloscyllium punctatum]|uniref:Uncharacterized protein n=1 Tax=Chiloscyllium punctatum TaxID=137246 RepID=A0A401SKD2_CHIPU|nr:hypothetical protein [Chiloscyllium punctatum]
MYRTEGAEHPGQTQGTWNWGLTPEGSRGVGVIGKASIYYPSLIALDLIDLLGHHIAVALEPYISQAGNNFPVSAAQKEIGKSGDEVTLPRYRNGSESRS